MKCPYCNEDLKEWDGRFYCANAMCPAKQEYLPKFIWRDLINSNKTQTALNVAIKDIIQLQEENNRYKRALEIARKEYLVVVENWARILCDYRPQRIQHYIIEYRAEYDKQINKILKKD